MSQNADGLLEAIKARVTLDTLRALMAEQKAKTGHAPKRAQVSPARFQEIAALFDPQKLYVAPQSVRQEIAEKEGIPGITFDGCFFEAIEDLPEPGPIFVEEVEKYRMVQVPLDGPAHELLATLRSRYGMTNPELITMALMVMTAGGNEWDNGVAVAPPDGFRPFAKHQKEQRYRFFWAFFARPTQLKAAVTQLAAYVTERLGPEVELLDTIRLRKRATFGKTGDGPAHKLRDAYTGPEIHVGEFQEGEDAPLNVGLYCIRLYAVSPVAV